MVQPEKYDPKFLEKVEIFFKGSIEVGYREYPGWVAPTMFYAFYCPRHGYVVDYDHTYGISCPFCDQEHREGKRRDLLKDPSILL